VSSYVGEFTNDPIVDMMLDTIVDRGYSRETMYAATTEWIEADGPDNFWRDRLGPAIDALESTLGSYGLTKDDKEEDDATD
jgi:hypothetical protein